MKRLALLCCFALSACLNFDEKLGELCAAGKWADCPPVDAGEPGRPDGGPNDEDAGTDAGSDGGTLGGDFSDGGLGACKNSWCWESPGIFGSPSLFSIWGRSDSDFWVGAAGGLLLHFNGTSWNTEPISETFQWNSAVQAGFMTPDGQSWVCPSLDAPVRVSGVLLSPWGSGSSCGGADWWNGNAYFISNPEGPVYRFPGAPLPAVTGGPSVYGRRALAAGTNGVMLGESGSDSLYIDWYVPGESTGHRGAVTKPDGGGLGFITAIRRGPNDEVWLLATDGAHSFFGKLTDAGVTLTELVEPQEALYDFGYSADAGWWFAGDNMYLRTGVTDPMALTANTSDQYQSLNAGWRSPQGTLWVVGEAGMVTRNGTPLGPYIQNPLFDIVTSDPIIAVGGSGGSTGEIWVRGDAGLWSVQSKPGDLLLAVARTRDGGLTTFDNTGKTFEGTTLLSAAGTVNASRATLAVDPYDTIWLQTPDKLQFWGADRQEHAIAPDVGMLFTDLAIAPDGGVLITLRDSSGNNNGGLATLMPDAGISWIVGGKRFDTVASWPSGFAAMSANEMQSCQPTCVNVTLTPGGSPMSLVAFGAADMYLLHADGTVYHYTGAAWLNVSPPIGYEGNPFFTSRLRASPDGNSLYLVGDDGAILKRSLP